MFIGSKVRTAAVSASALFAFLAVAGCASAEPYNPSHLDGGQLGRVEGVCQSAMGLSPSEPPIWGPGDPNLTPGENHYQGCVASLSDTLRRINRSDAALQADADCRARGLTPGSAGLAECVLHGVDAKPSIQPASTAMLASPGGQAAAPPRGSFFFAGGAEINRRERLACAELGLNPAFEGFASCVKDMDDTFFAIDNPHN